MFFWRRRQRDEAEARTHADPLTESSQPRGESGPSASPGARSVRLERDEPRPAAIQRVTEELQGRGELVVALFEEVTSPRGRAVLPIRLRRDPNEDVFVEVVTGPWDERTVEGLLRSAAVLRGSGLAEATLEVLSAYPPPEEVAFFSARSAAALLQLDLFERDDAEDPAASAWAFAAVASRRWDLNLDYDPEELPQVGERVLAVLDEADGNAEGNLPILDALVRCLGCYVGETLRRNSPVASAWGPANGWGEDQVLEFSDGLVADPIGKTRAFLQNGPDDSVAFYVAYALKKLDGQGQTEGDG
jgi:hypothetical protein